MKIAYVFATDQACTFKLATMILPQLEGDFHGVEVVGMMSFDDNVFSLRAGDPVGERLAKVASEKGILLMACDQCAVRRNLAEGTLEQCGGRHAGAMWFGSGPAQGYGGRSRSGMLPAALRGLGRQSSRSGDHLVGRSFTRTVRGPFLRLPRPVPYHVPSGTRFSVSRLARDVERSPNGAAPRRGPT